MSSRPILSQNGAQTIPSKFRLYGVALVNICSSDFLSLVAHCVSQIMVLHYFRSYASRDSVSLKVTICVLRSVVLQIRSKVRHSMVSRSVLATLEAIFSSHQVYDMFIIKLGDAVLLREITLYVN